MPTGVYTLADGTQVYEDASGNVSSYQAPDGRSYLPDSSIVDDYVRSIAGAINQRIQRELNPPAAGAMQGTTTRAGVNAGAGGALGLVVIAGVVLGFIALSK
jgi:hypothetical protein